MLQGCFTKLVAVIIHDKNVAKLATHRCNYHDIDKVVTSC